MDIHKLIAGISPETYCQPESAKQVRRLLRKKDTVSPPEAVLQAAMLAEPKPANLLPLERLEEMDPFDCPGLKSPRAQFTYARDAMAESIEAFYFSILDHLESLEGWHVFKLVDEFQTSLMASPFAEAAKQQSLIQRQVFEGLEAVHTLAREILDTAQKLEALESSPDQKESNSSSGHGRYDQRDAELRRARLRSQLSLLKLRAAAIRPWLQRGMLASPLQGSSSSLVNAFNTAVFQVVLLARGPDVLPDAIKSGHLPRWMTRKVKRTYRPVIVLELGFRARPHRSRSQGYAYRGKAELTLTSYGFHDDELSLLRKTVESDALRNSLKMGTGEATDALDDLVRRIEQVLQPQPAAPLEESSSDTNPFSALLSLLTSLLSWLSGRTVGRSSTGAIDLRLDARLESVARSLAILKAHQDGLMLAHALRRAPTLAGDQA